MPNDLPRDAVKAARGGLRVLAATWLVVIVLAITPAIAFQEQESWRGVVDLTSAGGEELELFVTFTLGDPVTATISIPAQEATDVELSEVVYTAERIEFGLAAVGARFVADRDGDAATGTLTQGLELPLNMRRTGGDAAEAAAAAAPNRPQTPQPPFPYQARDVSYPTPDEGNMLAGTLTVPAGSGPHPAVLLITGSGSQDRDSTIFHHKSFWVIADHLGRRGIAVLRVDDRGVGGSDGVRADLTSADFARDVRAGVEFLETQPDIDAGHIGLIGHSEGGLIAPMVAADADDIAFVVLLAGPGVSGAELMPLQNEMLLRAAGATDAQIRTQLDVLGRLYAALSGDAEASVVEAVVDKLLDLQLAGVPEAQRAEVRDNARVAALQQVGSAWFRYFLVAQPRDYLTRVGCPVLALNGTLDLQVSADQNLGAIEAALAEGGNSDVTTRQLEGLNHLFQNARTGQVAEYAQIEETFAPEVLDLVTDWLLERVSGR